MNLLYVITFKRIIEPFKLLMPSEQFRNHSLTSNPFLFCKIAVILETCKLAFSADAFTKWCRHFINCRVLYKDQRFVHCYFSWQVSYPMVAPFPPWFILTHLMQLLGNPGFPGRSPCHRNPYCPCTTALIKKKYVYHMGFVIKKGVEKPEIVRFKKHKSNSSLQTRLG